MERISRIEGQFQPEAAAAETLADPFEPADVPYAWGSPRSEGAPPPPLFLTAEPTPEPEPEPPAAPEPTMAAEPPAPLLHAVDNRMRNQLTSADSRADRLVRQVRNEVEQLKQTLESLSFDHDDMVELDIAALLADPEHAATLPPALLVRALIETAEENDRLRDEVGDQRTKATKLRRQLRGLRREDAARQARLDTLEEVIAALHANLEDLRYDRDRARLAGPQSHALRASSAQLPPASSGMNSCE
jgi:septal ring factor EnvC (AmiA/AmiB activator)